MRCVLHLPAEQLHSVCQRWQTPLAAALVDRKGRQRDRIENALPGDRTCEPVTSLRVQHEDEFDQRHALQRVEAVLLLAREPLTSRKLSQYANLADGTQARTLVRHLNERYDASGRAFRVERVAGGFQLLTRRKFAVWLRRLAHVPGESRLSAPSLETLAVIAYRQPVPRADIEAVRGVNCGEILRQLMERDLVRIDGRSEELGRPYLYSTTRRFLQLFGLVNLDALPRADALRNAPLPVGLPPANATETEPATEPELAAREFIDE